MEKISEYMTIEAKNSASLDRQVNKSIAEGWQPLGGVSVAAFFDSTEYGCMSSDGGPTYVYMQAIVKYS